MFFHLFLFSLIFRVANINPVATLDLEFMFSTRGNPTFLAHLNKEGLLNATKITKVIIPDWLDSKNLVYSSMTKAFLRKYDCNVIFVDWSRSNDQYPISKIYAKIIGQLMADHIYYIFSNYSLVHVIGSGLAAHAAGHFGKRLRSVSEGKAKIGRITALDPSFPLFNDTSDEGLQKDDADVVDVVHCDGGRLGFEKALGTIDFYPNGGVAPQPGCSDLKVEAMDLFYQDLDEG